MPGFGTTATYTTGGSSPTQQSSPPSTQPSTRTTAGTGVRATSVPSGVTMTARGTSDTSPRTGMTTTQVVQDLGQGSNALGTRPQGSVQIDPATDNYRPVNGRGFSRQRPEILALFGFEPAFDGVDTGIVTSVGEMLDVQMSARRIKAENVIRLINELKVNGTTAKILTELQARIEQQEQAADVEIQFYQRLVATLAAARRALNISTNGSDIVAQVGRSRQEIGFGPARDLPPPRTLQQIMVQDLKFSDPGVKQFTNTKVMAQVLDDLRVIVSSFSPKTFDLPNIHRANDSDPTSLSTLEAGRAVSSFAVSDIATSDQSGVLIGASRASFDRFLSGLASVTTPEDRLKLLYGVMSKELRVSSGLSIKSVSDTLSQVFGLPNTGDVFQGMIGNVGDSVVQPVRSQDRTIANLLRVQAGNRFVFPFEPARVRQYFLQYIPGREYYVDSIVQGQRRFQTSQFTDYAEAFHTAISSLAYVVEGTLDVDVINSKRAGLNPGDIFKRVVALLAQHIEQATPAHTSPDTRDEFTLSVLNQAATDADLKYLLFLKVLLDGFYDRHHPSTSGGDHSFYIGLEGAGLTPDSVLLEIASVGEATPFVPGRGFAFLASTFSDLRESIRLHAQEPVIERLNVGQGILAGLIVNHILASQALYVEISFSVETSPGLDPIGSSTHLNPNERRIDSGWAFEKLSGVGGIFRGLNSVLNELDARARVGITGTSATANPNGYYRNGTGLTKFSGLGGQTFPMMLLEMAVSTVNKLAFTSIAGLKTDRAPFTDIIVKLVDADAQIAQAVMDQFKLQNRLLLLTWGNEVQRNRYRALALEFLQVFGSLDNEDRLVRSIVETFLAISTNLRNVSRSTAQFFDLQGPNREILAALDGAFDAADRFSALDTAQTTLARHLLIEYRNARAEGAALDTGGNAVASSGVSPFVDDSVVSAGVRNALFSLLKEPPMLSGRGNNAHIVSVALPAGFTDSLHERLGTYIVGQDVAEFERRLNLQNDVVKVNVYMQDLLFDDLVFKPASFVFELGRFVAGSSLSSVQDDLVPYERVVNQLGRSRVVTPDGVSFVTHVGKEQIDSDPSYGFLTDEQKLELVRNHMTSYLLGVYVRLLTGVDMSEDAFPINETVAGQQFDDLTRQRFEELLTTHVSQFAKRKVTLDELRNSNEGVRQLLDRLDALTATEGVTQEIRNVIDGTTESEDIEISQDLVTFMDSFSRSSIIFGAGARRQRVVSPKMFERIFHMLIDPDDFEVDVELSSSTTAGAALLNSDMMRRVHIFEHGRITRLAGPISQIQAGQFARVREVVRLDSSRRRDLGNLSLRQFFVTVEQLPELPSLGGDTRPTLQRRPEAHQVKPPREQLSTGRFNASAAAAGLGPSTQSSFSSQVPRDPSTFSVRSGQEIRRTTEPGDSITTRRII